MALILAGLLGVFISLVGVWFITSPFNAVQAFGVDPSHLADIALSPGLGIRDLALGLIIISFALARKPGATGTALLLTSIVPIGDYTIAESVGAVIAWAVGFVVAELTFIWIAWKKTGGAWRWRWGSDDIGK